MGQEASLPADPDLEEQARAPPSSTNPPAVLSRQQLLQQQQQQQAHNRPGSKLMNGIFRHGHETAEGDVVLWAAEGDDSPPPPHYNYPQNHAQPQIQHPIDDTSQKSAVGVILEAPSSTSKTKQRLSIRPSIIQSMRQLSLRPGKKTTVNNGDWEKQWDNDEDSGSSSDDGDNDDDAIAKPATRPALDQSHDAITLNDILPTAAAATITISDTNTAKPHLEMFMPMLRVLGKGSFGKVRVLYDRCIWFCRSNFNVLVLYTTAITLGTDRQVTLLTLSLSFRLYLYKRTEERRPDSYLP
jgi:hypothetical protein